MGLIGDHQCCKWHPPLLHAYLSALNRMLEIPERQLRLKDLASSQRPSRASLLEELRRVPGGADPGLLECVARGAAFHHAGEWVGGWLRVVGLMVALEAAAVRDCLRVWRKARPVHHGRWALSRAAAVSCCKEARLKPMIGSPCTLVAAGIHVILAFHCPQA